MVQSVRKHVETTSGNRNFNFNQKNPTVVQSVSDEWRMRRRIRVRHMVGRDSSIVCAIQYFDSGCGIFSRQYQQYYGSGASHLSVYGILHSDFNLFDHCIRSKLHLPFLP